MTLKISYAGTLVDPNQKFWYIPINENADIEITSTLEEKKWKQLSSTHIVNEDKFLHQTLPFAILRDPYEHWVLSFVTHLKNSKFSTVDLENVSVSKYNDNFYELFFEWAPFFTSELQSDYFLNYPNLKKVNFFWVHAKLGHQLSKWFQTYDELIPFNNSMANNYDKKDKVVQGIISFLFNHKNHKIRDKIMKHLQPDYDFINGINFYV
jgi:hypothetical protein